jgi:ribosomal-protein-alanine N-acetyltransferase
MREIIFAKKEHIPMMAALEAKSFSNPWSESSLNLFFDTESAIMVICLEDGCFASYCNLLTVLDEVQIINVATDPAFKKQGCAKAVLEFVLEESKKRGITTISLEVRESNIPAISLYESLGFFVAGKRKDFYTDPRENALVMIKNLD